MPSSIMDRNLLEKIEEIGKTQEGDYIKLDDNGVNSWQSNIVNQNNQNKLVYIRNHLFSIIGGIHDFLLENVPNEEELNAIKQFIYAVRNHLNYLKNINIYGEEECILPALNQIIELLPDKNSENSIKPLEPMATYVSLDTESIRAKISPRCLSSPKLSLEPPSIDAIEAMNNIVSYKDPTGKGLAATPLGLGTVVDINQNNGRHRQRKSSSSGSDQKRTQPSSSNSFGHLPLSKIDSNSTCPDDDEDSDDVIQPVEEDNTEDLDDDDSLDEMPDKLKAPNKKHKVCCIIA